MRSKPIEQLLAEARELAADGAVELNLIGQDTTSYGTDIGYAAGLGGLLRTLNRELKDVHWLRLMYAYPSCFTDEMIRTIADADRVVKYIDMPLQHIDDEMLTKMRRRVTRKQIETLLGKLRAWVPGISIRTTFIAGSPGETDAQHAELVGFVKDFGFDMMGVFPYSQEPGTPMGRMEGQLPDAVKQQRVEELMLAQQEVAFARARRRVGRTVEVLIDRPAGRDEEDGHVARTQGQAPDIDSVTFVHGPGLHPGRFVTVSIADYQAYDLVANVPKQKSRSLAVLKASRKRHVGRGGANRRGFRFTWHGFSTRAGELLSRKRWRPNEPASTRHWQPALQTLGWKTHATRRQQTARVRLVCQRNVRSQGR